MRRRFKRRLIIGFSIELTNRLIWNLKNKRTRYLKGMKGGRRRGLKRKFKMKGKRQKLWRYL